MLVWMETKVFRRTDVGGNYIIPMKKTLIILLFAFTNCIGQTSTEKNTEKLLRKWSFMQFEEIHKDGNNVTICTEKAVENVLFIFNSDYTLDVISNLKKEKYSWKLKKYLIEINSIEPESKNAKILGVFEIKFLDNIFQLFLQRKNESHNGIMLKKQ